MRWLLNTDIDSLGADDVTTACPKQRVLLFLFLWFACWHWQHSSTSSFVMFVKVHMVNSDISQCRFNLMLFYSVALTHVGIAF